ncbi:Uncharacterised protein [Klebsiella variicola]|nr:Uncharacterised protein [Klebsiella variicola]
MVPFYPCRTKTFQHMKYVFQLCEQNRMDVGFQPQVPEEFQFSKNIN